jgi:hypothetical protein
MIKAMQSINELTNIKTKLQNDIKTIDATIALLKQAGGGVLTATTPSTAPISAAELENLILSISGEFSSDQVVKMATQRFGENRISRNVIYNLLHRLVPDKIGYVQERSGRRAAIYKVN